MGGKIAIVGLGLFLGLSSLYAQDTINQNTVEPRYMQVDLRNDEFYKKISSLSKKEIVALYKLNSDMFYEKYRYYNSSADFSASLDSKVFEAFGEAFLCHNFLDLEEKVYFSESENESGSKTPIYLFEKKLINENHARTILLYGYILKNIKNSEPQGILKDIYSNLRNTMKFNENSKLLPEDILVNYGFTKAKFDSFQLSLIYSDLAQILGVDFSPVRVRDKFYIQYEENKFFNPFDGATYSQDEIIKNNVNIGDGIKNHVLLNRLTKDQLIAVEYARFGWSNVISMQRERMRLEEFIKGLTEVPNLLKTDPKGIQDCIRIFTQNAADLSKGAEHCFKSALLLDNSSIETYLFRGQLYNQVGINFWDPDKTEITSVDFGKWNMKLLDTSIDDFQNSIRLDPGDWRGYELLGFAYFDKTTLCIHNHEFDNAEIFEKKAQDSFTKSHELKGDEEPEVPSPKQPPKNIPNFQIPNSPTT